MAFEYGAQKLNIRNPFRFEGLVRSIRGAILLAIGVYLLFQIQPLLGTDKPRAWVNLLIGGLFVTGGLKALGGGLFQVMRFFVGRAAPASLAKNVAREAVNEREPTLYNSKMLHNMLMSKSNPTFIEPTGWFGRLYTSDAADERASVGPVGPRGTKTRIQQHKRERGGARAEQ